MLIEVEPLTDIIKLTLQTAYLKHLDTPVNLLLIAKPESAKTKALTKFKIKGTYTTNNITQSVIASKIFPMIENRGVKHIIIPDILNAIGNDRRTSKATINLFKSLIEEGITSLDQFNIRTHKVYNPPIKCGLITAITSESYHGYYNPLMHRTEGGIKHYWRRIGMLSRLIPFSYEYKISKILKIFEFIQNEEHEQKTMVEKIKRRKTEIKGDKELFKKLELVSIKVGTKIGCYGIRLQKALQYLAKANALLNGRIEVAGEDINKVLELGNWINYDFNTL